MSRVVQMNGIKITDVRTTEYKWPVKAYKKVILYVSHPDVENRAFVHETFACKNGERAVKKKN